MFPDVADKQKREITILFVRRILQRSCRAPRAAISSADGVQDAGARIFFIGAQTISV